MQICTANITQKCEGFHVDLHISGYPIKKNKFGLPKLKKDVPSLNYLPAFHFFTASVNLGRTSNKSPTTP